jgi:hypothetical protein
LAQADDKHEEAHYFIGRMMDEWHYPSEFRWNLNAFVQALRNVTFALQSTLADQPRFRPWYEGQQDAMRSDPLLRKYGVLRNWIAEDLGEGSVLELCDEAWSKIGDVLSAAHTLVGWNSTPPPRHGHDISLCNLLTESDVDPSLPKKWDWC